MSWTYNFESKTSLINAIWSIIDWNLQGIIQRHYKLRVHVLDLILINCHYFSKLIYDLHCAVCFEPKPKPSTLPTFLARIMPILPKYFFEGTKVLCRVLELDFRSNLVQFFPIDAEFIFSLWFCVKALKNFMQSSLCLGLILQMIPLNSRIRVCVFNPSLILIGHYCLHWFVPFVTHEVFSKIPVSYTHLTLPTKRIV